jgi:23S rRNA (adenine2503-C2)-methyltransferase
MNEGKWYCSRRRFELEKMDVVNLVGASLEEIEIAVAGLNEPVYRARQVYAGIYRNLLSSWDQFTDLGKPLREKLELKFVIQHPAPRQVFVSHDGTRR